MPVLAMIPTRPLHPINHLQPGLGWGAGPIQHPSLCNSGGAAFPNNTVLQELGTLGCSPKGPWCTREGSPDPEGASSVPL